MDGDLGEQGSRTASPERLESEEEGDDRLKLTCDERATMRSQVGQRVSRGRSRVDGRQVRT